MPFWTTAAILGGTALASSAIGAHAAGSAADAQVQAANTAAELQHQDAQAALKFNEGQAALNQKNLAPWLQGGSSAFANLSYLMGTDPKSFATTPEPGIPGAPTTPMTIPGPGGTSVGGNRFGDIPGVHANRFIPDDMGGPVGTNVPQFTRDPNTGAMVRTSSAPTNTNQIPMLSSLINPSLGARGSLLAPFTEKFAAPTNITEKNDPGYAFRLDQGNKALERSAAAKGGLITGGTAADEGKFAQDYASNEYGNVYNRAFNEYSDRYNIFKQNQADQFNRLAALSGVGQTTASTLGTLGNNSAQNAGTILMNSGQQIGNDITAAGNATASGYINSANAINGGLNTLGQLPYLSMLLKNGMSPDDLWNIHG